MGAAHNICDGHGNWLKDIRRQPTFLIFVGRRAAARDIGIQGSRGPGVGSCAAFLAGSFVSVAADNNFYLEAP